MGSGAIEELGTRASEKPALVRVIGMRAMGKRRDGGVLRYLSQSWRLARCRCRHVQVQHRDLET